MTKFFGICLIIIGLMWYANKRSHDMTRSVTSADVLPKVYSPLRSRINVWEYDGTVTTYHPDGSKSRSGTSTTAQANEPITMAQGMALARQTQGMINAKGYDCPADLY